jgi:hypothetical protein
MYNAKRKMISTKEIMSVVLTNITNVPFHVSGNLSYLRHDMMRNTIFPLPSSKS